MRVFTSCQNLLTRVSMLCFARLTHTFNKKLEGLEAAARSA
jgi:hypothetical protein